jgi:hypothetical protein
LVLLQELADAGDDLGGSVGSAAGAGADEDQRALPASLGHLQMVAAALGARVVLVANGTLREALDEVATRAARLVRAAIATR